MAFVDVIIIGPNGQEYEAEIDENSDEEQLLSQLLGEMQLEDNGEYEILFSTRGIKDGTKIRIIKKPQKLVHKFRPK